jgi:hypothetical protein
MFKCDSAVFVSFIDFFLQRYVSGVNGEYVNCGWVNGGLYKQGRAHKGELNYEPKGSRGLRGELGGTNIITRNSESCTRDILSEECL